MSGISELGQTILELAKKGPDAAHEIMRVVGNPEVARSLQGPERQAFLDAVAHIQANQPAANKIGPATMGVGTGLNVVPDTIKEGAGVNAVPKTITEGKGVNAVDTEAKGTNGYGKVDVRGLAPLGIGFTSPVDYIKQGVQAYEGFKKPIADAIGERFDPAHTGAASTISNIANVALDPLNLVEGPAGAAIAGAQMLGGSSEVPQYAEGGGVESFDPDAFLAAHDAVAQQPPGMQAPATPPPGQSSGPRSFDPDAFLADYNEEKYGTTEQMLKTGVEGVAKGFLGPLAPLAEKHVLGVKEEDILGREEANPVTHGVGQAAGLAGGLLTGTGEAALMVKAGTLAQEAAGLARLGEGASYAARVGSAAVQQAAEMAVLQSGDEASKMILNDPNASAESALMNIGLASALGGAGGAFVTGAISPLWRATVGDRTEQFLGSLASKLGGTEAGSTSAQELAFKAGIEVPDVLAAKINNAPGAAEAFSKLSQTDTTLSGQSVQKTLGEFHDHLGNKMVETLGHEPGYVKNLPELDKYTAGQTIGETLHKDLEARTKPITEAYDKITEQFKGAAVSAETQTQAADRIAQKVLAEGWNKISDDPSMRIADKVIKDLNKQETALDLKNYISNLRNSHPYGTDGYQAAKSINKILTEAQERAITEGIIAKGGGNEMAQTALKEYQGLKSQYADLMSTFEDVNNHLHVGRYQGPQSFLQNLKEMSSVKAEAVLNRLAGGKNANALDVLAQISPETLAQIRQYHVDTLLHSATSAEGTVSPYKLASQFEKLSPQVKNLIATEEQQGRLTALAKLADGLKDDTHNWSNTARTVDKLTHGAASPLVLIAGLLGHSGEALLAHIGRLGFTEGRDALKLGLLKFLGSEQPIKSEGFKAMIDFFHNTIKGENLLAQGTKAVFKSGAQVLTDKMMPAKADREKLDKAVTRAEADPQFLLKLAGSHTGHYLPGHQTAMAQAATTQVQYLQALKPKPYQPNPLDKPIAPSAQQEARYNRALDIATQPAIVLHHIKNGTLQTSDLKDLKAMAPALYSRMAQKLTNEMMNHKAEDAPIPYTTRMGLSLFLGQPMDSTMTPQAIQMAQPPPSAAPPQGPSPGRKGTGSLGKMNKTYMTPNQAAEAAKAGRD